MQLREVAAKYEATDEEAFRRIRLINLHYQIALERLGPAQLHLTEALTYSNFWRPSRDHLEKKQEDFSEKYQGLLNYTMSQVSSSYRQTTSVLGASTSFFKED